MPDHRPDPDRASDAAHAKPDAPAKAAHGAPSEVTWRSGEGRQPYANQGAQEAPPANLGNEFADGDRGEHSGVNLDQLERVKTKP